MNRERCGKSRDFCVLGTAPLNKYIQRIGDRPRLFQMEPAYKSTGDTSKDRLAFFHLIEQLKVRYISESSSNLTILNIGDVFYADTETNWMAQ